jgi:uncharacterized protein (TIGR02001 family)
MQFLSRPRLAPFKPACAAAMLAASAGALAQAAADAPEAAGGAVAAGAAPAPAAAPLTGNAALTSNYVSRGFTQSWGQPALQGGLDYAHPSGLYVGTWLSSLSGSEFRGGTVEWDLYGGYTGTAGPLGYTGGLYYYYYPGTSSPAIGGRRYDYAELKLGLSYGLFAANYYYTLTKDWFGTFSDGRGTGYLDLTATVDLGQGFTLVAHGGGGSVANHSEANWTDAKLGVSKTFDGAWTLGAAVSRAWDKDAFWTGADFSADASGAVATKRLGDTAFAVTLSKTF